MSRITLVIPLALAGCVSYQPLALIPCTGDCVSGGDAGTHGDRVPPGDGQQQHTDELAGDGDAGDPLPGDCPPGDAAGDPALGDPALGDPVPANPCEIFSDGTGDTPVGAEQVNLMATNPQTMSRSVCLDDFDYFRFWADRDDWVNVGLTWPPNGEGLTWRLVTCTMPAVVIAECQGETTAIGVTGCLFQSNGETMCVEVSAPGLSYNKRIDYELTIGTVANPECAYDYSEPHDVEIWPHDLPGVPPINNTNGTLCPGDVDWYRFPTGAEPAITIELYVEIPLNPAVDYIRVSDCHGALLDPQQLDCRTVGGPGSTSFHQCGLWFETPEPAYCFGVFGPAGVATTGLPYTIRVADALLCGDPSGTANNVRAEATTYDAAIIDTQLQLCMIDRDWFAYDNSGSGDRDLEIAIVYLDDPMDSVFGPDLHLELSDGTPLGCPAVVMLDGSRPGHSRKICGATLLPGDVLYIEVSPNVLDGEDYVYDYYFEVTEL